MPRDRARLQLRSPRRGRLRGGVRQRGQWAQFFAHGRGYIGTELLRDVEIPGRYLVIDRWESADAYNAFANANRDEYMRRVDDTRFYYEQELRLGTFESA